MDVPVWLQIVMVLMAACQITETARHGALFQPLRARLESCSAFLNDAINCGFCFSHWAAALAVLLLVGHHLWPITPVDPFLCTLVWLSATRGANLLNDLTKKWSRTPARDDVPLPDFSLKDCDEPEQSADRDE